MKIVVLDGYTLNPGDLSWNEFEKIGDLEVYDRTPKEFIVERSKGAEIILTNKTPMDREIFSKLPNLKYIGVLATGYDVVDIKAAKENNIIVTNIPTYGTSSVAQMVFALLLELCNRVQYHSEQVKNGVWSNKKDFCFWDYPLVELYGKTMGIIGFGRIGQETAKIAQAFGMKVIVYDKVKNKTVVSHELKYVELSEIFRKSDVVSLHCPLFADTKGIINKESLSKMKSTAFLINTSRGPLIDEKDLSDALNEGKIAGAAVDVLSKEPPVKANYLLSAKNCIVTPHISWATKEARLRLMNIAFENVCKFIKENPINVVN